MTKPKLVFNPVAQDYFDNPYEIYRRMRDEAPIYYDEDEDFYALTRHADVSAGFKDSESFSSARGCDLAMVRRAMGGPSLAMYLTPDEGKDQAPNATKCSHGVMRGQSLRCATSPRPTRDPGTFRSR